MDMHSLMMYKVVEVKGAVVIMQQHDNIKNDSSATPLVIADSATMVEYLARYFHGRESGKPMKDAHEAALAGAKIIRRGDLEGKIQ